MHFVGRRRGVKLRPDLLRAVDGVSLTVRQGETLGLIGESGCGKSTLARIMVRLLEPTSGRVLVEGRDVAHLRGRDLRDLHRDVQLVFQDPLSSLNPRQTVARAIGAPFEIHSDASPAAVRKATGELLELVGLRPAQLDRYPHELSGGQQQRVAIARALALRPKVLVADEPFAALDVSTQARIIDLLAELRTVREFALVVVAHDLSLIQRIADRIAVMYLGRIVELADTEALYASPRHPYTEALLLAMPVLNPTGTRSATRSLIPGDVPSPYRIPSGCRFRTRCPLAREECATSDPQLRELAAAHVAACHYPLSHFTWALRSNGSPTARPRLIPPTREPERVKDRAYQPVPCRPLRDRVPNAAIEPAGWRSATSRAITTRERTSNFVKMCGIRFTKFARKYRLKPPT